ncbi:MULTISPECIES: DUF4197 domain-containing protein [Thalassospira]|uniref:DUF4197 domain-containing protein n=2 Tax=Thalassospira TaxID=168934 RepID=A0A367WDE0_9PROT|nr:MULTISPECIES: DUF4197 domain-containing protein [Thalassospira]MDG4720054.1 DUF4197 domain-containing protein [Thalassospira sp. FZY0004]RCK38490.1 hypothetical protein TH19_06760 [Thalassospira profundimaris]
MQSHPFRTIRRTSIVVLGTAIMVAGLSQPSFAQSFFDKAKQTLGEALNSTTTGSSSGSTSSAISALSSDTVEQGLKQALDIGVGLVTDQLGAKDGFNADPVAHIPLPESVKTAQKLLSAAGLGSYADEIELRMNRAAEQTMNDAGDILLNAVKQMTVADAKGILEGPDDAATSYLRRVSGSDIESRLRPVITDALSETGALSLYDQMVGQYDTLPFVPDLKASLTDHATDKAMEGLFHYIALQEADIRSDPTRWTTDILKKVFSAAN